MATPIANAGSDITIAQADVASTKSISIPAATGTDSAGGTSIASFQWTIVSKPSGSSVSFSSGTDATASPTLNSVDTWGNYLLLCKVTDTYGQSSAATYSTAPSSALLTIRVNSTTLSLQKPAAGERNWSDVYAKLVEKVEAQAISTGSPTVAALTDTSATGAQLNTLVGGGTTTLHSHTGLTIDPATTLARGTVQLAEAALAGTTPKVMTQARGSFSGHARIEGGTPGTASIAVSNAASNGVTSGTPDLITVTLPWDMPGPNIGQLRLVSGTGYPTVSTSANFDWVGGSGSDSTQAANIAGAINNAFRGIRASASGSTVTIRSNRGGVDNNSIDVTYTANGSSIMSVTSFSGGSDTMDSSKAILVFRAEEDVTLTSWQVSASSAPATSDMKFYIHKISAAELSAGSFSDSNKVGEINCKHGASSDEGLPKQVSATFDPVVSVTAGQVLAIRPFGGTFTQAIDVWGQVFWRRRF